MVLSSSEGNSAATFVSICEIRVWFYPLWHPNSLSLNPRLHPRGTTDAGSLEQRGEARLLEMLIAGQGLRDALLVHDNERKAVVISSAHHAGSNRG